MNATLIHESQRIAHTAQLFGVHFPCRLEPTVYALASELSPDYRGGYWHFYHLDHGTFFMAPGSETPFHLTSPNGFAGVLSPEAFGITVCLFAYSNLCFGGDADFTSVCASHFHGLRRYALAHPEAQAILAAID
jgi:hypothetical protein